MKRVILLLLLAGMCVLLAFKLFRTTKAPSRIESTEAQCDQSLWQYIYNPGRLHVINSCMSVTGTVEGIRKEADGDIHIRFRLDRDFESLLNEKNISKQQGTLVLEPVCQGKVRQADATELCSRYSGPYFAPQMNQRYRVSGAYVHDADHGWNELHPVSDMQLIPINGQEH
jgi:hypothetical protein